MFHPKGHRTVCIFVLFGIFPVLCQAFAESPGDTPGHSTHAPAFDEGPRQAAYLMDGMGNVHWEVSTKNAMAQRFFDQGITQLHGFWYFEAERSFRTAAAIDPECAMFYWGMARANIENPFRSKGFIEVAMKKLDKANDKEKRLIEAWNKRVKDAVDDAVEEKESKSKPLNAKERKAAARAKRKDADKRREATKQALKQYAADLESIALDFPAEIELKAMLVLQYWQNDGQGLEMQSHVAMNALLSEIFRVNPRHPAQHFRIHLWDYRKENLAIEAAAMCGPSAPGIAHMWHMPGHTYTRLNRYSDAAWQQEASARVDHAHMIHDRIMPDQIHNYAHNNEWLVRNLMLVGRVKEAIDLAKNLIELPRHPKYNTLDGRGSASLGRERLLNLLTSYRLWPQLLEHLSNAYLEPTDNELRQDEHKAWLAIAYSNTGNAAKANELRNEIAQLIQTLRSSCIEGREALRLVIEKEEPSKSAPKPPELAIPFESGDDPFGDENDPAIEKIPNKEIDDGELEKWSEERKEKAVALRESEYRLAKLKQLAFAVDAYLAANSGNWLSALQHSNHCRNIVNNLTRIEWLAQAGHAAKALERIEKRVDESPNELLPLAIGLWIAAKNNLKEPVVLDRYAKMFDKLTAIAPRADLDIELLQRLEQSIETTGRKDKWRVPSTGPTDLGDRPPLESLGPYRWTPSLAPTWTAQTADGDLKSSKHYSKRPVVLILYLGIGCLHCAEQLKEFSPVVPEFEAAGMDVIAISTESVQQLQSGIRQFPGDLKIPLMANPELDAFKAFRCFDDFEGLPLHGTFLIDTQGRIRWQDTGAEPFQDPKFLLNEATRLLKL